MNWLSVCLNTKAAEDTFKKKKKYFLNTLSKLEDRTEKFSAKKPGSPGVIWSEVRL